MADDALRSRSRCHRVAVDERGDGGIGTRRAGHGDIGGMSRDQAVRRGVEAQPDVSVEEAVFAGARQQPRRSPALDGADVGIVVWPEMMVVIAGSSRSRIGRMSPLKSLQPCSS